MQNINRLTVYLGSSGRCRPVFKDIARKTGKLIGKQGKTLVYGGMDAGLMGIVANEALAAGAPVTGIIPKSLKDSERIHPGLTETILVPGLWERKRKMFRRADAIIVLPGGFGTLDEALEALYWGHLGAHAKPVVFINIENYWDDLLSWLETLPDYRKDLVIIANSPEEAFAKIENWSPPEFSGDSDHLPHFEDDILADTNAPLVIDKATVKDGYILATALGLKQLGKHNRPIGIQNKNDNFTKLLKWFNHAQTEHFVTDRCLLLFAVAKNAADLAEKLSHQTTIHIDLNKEKWGPGETRTHIEIAEKE
ncbi:MAG: TIGR00730 family Rossman fold protein [Alphaproteobacteria bacterium]|nr:TIGR00730 family Rossman fold protein [Alphaproteobacteria bacterium]